MRNLRRSRPELKPQHHSAEQLGLSLSSISPDAAKAVQTLQNAGHQTWLVGGCVRDLLLGLKPKDFDIATRARPDQITALFRRSRKVGKRFIIVLLPIRSGGRQMRFLEVSTLRKWPGQLNRQGLAVNDNNWSDKLTDDVLRRDFTANALYLDSVAGTVSDFTGGLDDIKSRVLRVVGDPAERFREDPVRLLRLARFRARYEFSVPDPEFQALQQCAPLLRQTDPSRMQLEIGKLLLEGRAERTFEVLGELDLLPFLIEGVALWRQWPAQKMGYEADQLHRQALQSTDRAVGHGHLARWGALLSALLWPNLAAKNSSTDSPQGLRAATDLLGRQLQLVGLPRQEQEVLLASWRHQSMLENEQVNPGTLAGKRFGQSLWLCRIRQRAGDPAVQHLDLDQWQQRHQRSLQRRQQQLKEQRAESGDSHPPGRRRSRRRRR